MSLPPLRTSDLIRRVLVTSGGKQGGKPLGGKLFFTRQNCIMCNGKPSLEHCSYRSWRTGRSGRLQSCWNGWWPSCCRAWRRQPVQSRHQRCGWSWSLPHQPPAGHGYWRPRWQSRTSVQRRQWWSAGRGWPYPALLPLWSAPLLLQSLSPPGCTCVRGEGRDVHVCECMCVRELWLGRTMVYLYEVSSMWVCAPKEGYKLREQHHQFILMSNWK